MRHCVARMIPLIIPCLLAPQALSAQAPAEWTAFTRTFQAYADSDAVVGASVVLVRDGRVIGRHHTGHADRAAGRPVDEHTIYHWGSITKTLTAIAIMQLRDRGRLSLHDVVIDHLPELRRVHDPYDALDRITIRMLLSHSAGFMNSTWPYDEGHDWQPFEPTEWAQLVAMMPYQRLLFEPGTRYGYSNPAFIYLARIIEQLTGDPWESYVQKNIFAPLGLQHSYFRSTPYYLAAHRSHNYHIERDSVRGSRLIDNGADFDPGITTPNGGWNAPLADLVKYVAFLTGAEPATGALPVTPVAQRNPVRAVYDVVLPRSSLEEMWRPVVPMAQGYEAGPGIAMGLSFFILERDGVRLLGHTGSQAGFRAFLYFNPANRTAVIAAFNTTNYASPASAAYRRMHEQALRLLY